MFLEGLRFRFWAKARRPLFKGPSLIEGLLEGLRVGSLKAYFRGSLNDFCKLGFSSILEGFDI